ncbi:MAG: TonB-dependent receptor [Saprospiraceae bacterium]
MKQTRFIHYPISTKEITVQVQKGIATLLFLFISQFAYSQSTITGSVTAASDDTVAFANVLLLLENDSSLVKGAITNELGSYQISQVKEGNYLIGVSMIGYTTNYSAPFEINGETDFQVENILLNKDEEMLEEVVVAALRPLYEQRMDRMIINIKNSITSAGGNGLEVLARAPGVEVNEINEVLSINGKSGVQVMINGKVSRLPTSTIMDMLRGMDASNIDRIELYETPPAHLDAEGNGGVINIIMIENKEIGTNGSYSANIGFGRRLKYGASINLNHRTERLNLYGTYTFRHRFTQQTYLFNRTVEQMNQLIITDSENDREGQTIRNTADIGFDYKLTDKTIVGLLASGFYVDNENTSNNTSTFSDETKVTEVIENLNEEEYQRVYGLINLNIKHQFNLGESISFDIDHLRYENDNPSRYFNDFLDGERNLLSESEVQLNSSTPIRNVSSKVDYSKTLNDKIGFQLGAKGTGSRFENNVIANEITGSTSVKLDEFSQDYELSENIAAAYGSVDYQLNEKTKFNFGLRYEYTDYHLSTPDEPDFLDLQYDYFFPSFFLARTIGDNQLQLSYSRRISRPAFNELAPFVTFIDPTTFFIGNPELQPGISNNLRTSYRFKTVQVSMSYSYSEDPIATYQPEVDPETNTQFYTTLNLGKEHSSSINVLIPYQPTKWWNIQSKFSGIFERLLFEENQESVSLDTRAFSAYVVNTFTLPNQFAMEVSGYYKSRAYYGLLEVKPRGFLNIGLQKRFRNGSLRLNYTDLFETNIWKSNTNIPEFNLNSDLVVGIETRIVTLSYAMNFGKATVKGKRRRSTGSEEEQRRIQ